MGFNRASEYRSPVFFEYDQLNKCVISYRLRLVVFVREGQAEVHPNVYKKNRVSKAEPGLCVANPQATTHNIVKIT
jgi:hypothetical protein